MQFYGIDISDTKLLVAGTDITYVFDINTFVKTLQIALDSKAALILSNGNYLISEIDGFCIFNNLGAKEWR